MSESRSNLMAELFGRLPKAIISGAWRMLESVRRALSSICYLPSLPGHSVMQTIRSGEELPARSNVVRLARPLHAVQTPPVGAFMLRKSIDEKELSFGWLEYFTDCPTEYERLGGACNHLALNRRAPQSDHVLQVDVDSARSLLAANAALLSVRIVYSPIRDDPALKDNPSHAEARGIHPLSDGLQQLTAEQLALAVTKHWKWRESGSLGSCPNRTMTEGGRCYHASTALHRTSENQPTTA